MAEETVKTLGSFRPHEFQKKVLKSKSRFIACIAGAQGGKTTVGAIWFLREIFDSYTKGERFDWLISAPTAKLLAQSTLPKFNEYFPPDWGTYKEQKQCYELTWGNRIYVRSGDEPDHIEGMTIKGAWFDEPGQMHHQMWINIQARLARHQGRMILTSTPYEMNWFWRDVEQRAGSVNDVVIDRDGVDDQIALYRWKSKDSPYFPMEEYNRAKKLMTPEMFARRYDGVFTRLEGLVYSTFDREKGLVDPFPIPAEWKRFAGLDFGDSHPTAVVCIAQKPEVAPDKIRGIEYQPSIFYIYREYYRSKCGLSELANFLNSERLSYILSDPRGATERRELSLAYGVKGLQTADNSVEVGIERLQQLFREDRLKLFRGQVPNTEDELTTYHYAAYNMDKGGRDEPMKVHDDAMDALRYAFSRVIEGLYRGHYMRSTPLRALARLRATGRTNEIPANSITNYS